MTQIALRAENLGKLYRIGPREPYRAVRDALANAMSAPFRAVSSVINGRQVTAGQPPSPNFLWALKGVSFEVKRGEVVGIIGRNGAGKSTLLKILSRITAPTEGHAEIHGRVGSLLEVGTGFHPELTGRENIYLNGAILGMKQAEIEPKFDEIVAFAEVEQFVDTPVKHYSSGMYLRLAFAVAAHLEPEILLVDEVLAVGDAAFQKKCIGKMGEVAMQGRTVLFVSHNMPAVRKLCSSAMLLESGSKEMAGPTDSVVARYLSATSSEMSADVKLPPGLFDAPGAGTCLRVVSQIGTPQAQFRLGEAWRIVMEFEMLRPAAQVIAAVGLVTIDSVPIITYWSKPSDLTPGRYSVEFDCTVPLGSCDIRFSVGLSSRERPFYYVSDIGHVSITDVAEGEQPFRASGSGFLLSPQRPDIRVRNRVGS